jgi:hypothetical protein
MPRRNRVDVRLMWNLLGTRELAGVPITGTELRSLNAERST